jgi:hypothetical protein
MMPAQLASRDVIRITIIKQYDESFMAPPM